MGNGLMCRRPRPEAVFFLRGKQWHGSRRGMAGSQRHGGVAEAWRGRRGTVRSQRHGEVAEAR